MRSSLYLWHIGFSLSGYGQGGGMVIAPNIVDAMVQATTQCEDGWMLSDPNVKVYRTERAFIAMCEHNDGEYRDENIVECADCMETWNADSEYRPEKCATKFGFEVYCENMRIARQYPYNAILDGE